jgi:hypothetical protein
VIEAVERFLHSVYEQHLRGRDDEQVSESEAADELVEH